MYCYTWPSDQRISIYPKAISFRIFLRQVACQKEYRWAWYTKMCPKDLSFFHLDVAILVWGCYFSQKLLFWKLHRDRLLGWGIFSRINISPGHVPKGLFSKSAIQCLCSVSWNVWNVFQKIMRAKLTILEERKRPIL